MNTLFIWPCSPFHPPKSTARLLSTAVKVRSEQGGGISPVVTGQLQAPAETEALALTVMYWWP